MFLQRYSIITLFGVLAITNAAPSVEKRAAVSKDGFCGKGSTCQGSAFGNCCSQWGYCGSSSDHCGSGCQSQFGTCDSSAAFSKASAALASPVSPTSKVASVLNKRAVSTKASAFSKASAYSKPVSAASATASGCTVAPTQVIANPSFEDGSSSWTLSPAASIRANGEDQLYYMSTTSGTNYAQLSSTVSNPSSTLSQNIASWGFSTGKLSFDWQFMVASQSRGPPSTECTLAVTLANGFMTVASWTRPGSQGGSGRIETGFSMGIGGGDVTFTFSCTDNGPQFSGAVLIDNVKFTGAC